MITKKISKLIFLFLVHVCFFSSCTHAEDLYRIKIGREGYGFINSSGELKIPIKYSSATSFKDGIAFVENEDGKRSGIDSDGNILFTLDVHSIETISEGLAVVAIREPNSFYSVYGYINKRGVYVIEPKYEDAEDFQEGLAVVTLDARGSDDREYFFINTKGEDVFKMRFSKASGFVGGYSYVEVGLRDSITYKGYIDSKGNLLTIPSEYETISEDDVSDGYIRLTKDNQYYFWNPKTNEMITVDEAYEAGRMSEGLYSVMDKKTGLFGVKNKDGELVIPCQHDYISHMVDGRMIYWIDDSSQYGLEGFLDEHGNVIIEAQFIILNHFNGELALFNGPNGFTGGYVSKTGEIFRGQDYLVR